MESRLRKFISARKDRASAQAIKVDQRSISSSSTSPWQVSAPPSRSGPVDTAHSPSNLTPNDLLLHAAPYNTIPPGKAPIFSSEPVKGNGPVKLHTSHRLSSGELVSTTQNNKRTLDDVKEGNYILGGKDKRDIRSQPLATARSRETAVSSVSASPASAYTSKPLPEIPPSSWCPSPAANIENYTPGSRESTPTGLGIHAASSNTSGTFVHQPRISLLKGAPRPRSSRTSTATSPSIRTLDEQNPTIAALWKAEYSRLANIYGREKMGSSVSSASMSLDQGCVFPTPPSRGCNRMIEVTLDPLPYPNCDKGDRDERRSSNISAASSICHEDTSDTSSHKRASLISSCAGSSSCTTQTSFTEHEAAITRDDIRKIVNEMRSTYLRALDTPPLPPKKSASHTKKKRRTKHMTSAPTSSAAPPPSRSGRQTWHGDDANSTEAPSRRTSKTRATSQFVGAFGRLSPVEASPPRPNARPTARLQRADSTTLGSIMAQIETDENDREQTAINLSMATNNLSKDTAILHPSDQQTLLFAHNAHNSSSSSAEPPRQFSRSS